MSRKIKFSGGDDDVISYTNAGSAIAAGSVVKMSHTLGIALVDIAATTGVGNVAIGGIVEVPKVAGNAWVIGEKLIYDVSAGPAFSNSATVVATGDVTGAAVAAVAALSADTVGIVKLTPGNSTLTP